VVPLVLVLCGRGSVQRGSVSVRISADRWHQCGSIILIRGLWGFEHVQCVVLPSSSSSQSVTSVAAAFAPTAFAASAYTATTLLASPFIATSELATSTVTERTSIAATSPTPAATAPLPSRSAAAAVMST